MTDPAVISHEVDFRFWAQTGYKPGLKLDPNDPTDKTMIPVWLDIQAKVKAEDAAGHLVLTYNHPVVTQNLADAHAASQAAAAHLDAAVTAPDPATAQQHVDAATDAANVAKQKTAAAAAVQPPSADPQVAQAASANAAQQPKHKHKGGHKHVAQAQAEGAGTQVAQTQSPGPVTSPDAVPAPAPTAPVPAAAHASRDIIDRETDARFWATGYKPGQKLNPNDPQDAKMIPVWLAIYKQVQAEDAAGKLVLTYNNPVVAQNIADAHVADQVAAQHIDAAAQAPDPATQQQHVEAATQATQVSAQKTAEIAQVQPASVPPPVAHQVARQVDPQPILVRDTYRAFWRTTHYKVGHPLNPHDPNDARWIPTWLAIYQQVQQAHGVQPPVPPTAQAQIAQTQAAAVGHRVEAQHRHRKHHGPVKSSVHPDSVREYRKAARQLAHAAGGQFVLVTVGPDGTPTQHVFGSRQELDAAYAQLADQHDQYKYIAAFDLTASPHKPIVDSVGIPAAEHVETPPSGPSAGAPADSAGAPDQGTAGSDPGVVEPEKKKLHLGTILVIGVGAVVTAGFVYAATKKPSRGTQAPRSKVAVAPMALARMP